MNKYFFGLSRYLNRPMLQLSRAIIIVLTISVMSGAQAAELTASVDRDTIGLEETFTLTLRYDEQISATPDYELLEHDFDILNTQSGTQMTIVNGRTNAFTEWKIALAPKRIGKFFIPSFNIQGAVSDAIEISIEGKSRSPKNVTDNVTVELETDKDTAYVQEQILVTIRLFTAVTLSGVSVEPLQVKDALVVQLDEKQYQTQINGRPHVVAETRYALFPQQSGELNIPSVLYQVSIDMGQRDLWNRLNGNGSNNMLRLRTEEQRLQINPAPDSIPSGSWLPAKNLSLTEHWSAGIDTLKVGEPITRTITLTAEGLTAGQITPLNLAEVKGLTFYQDQAQTDDKKTEQGVIGSRLETVAIIPNNPGQFTLPEVEVTWWDIAQKQIKTATLPAVTLNVTGSASTASIPTPSGLENTETETSVNINTNLNSVAAPSSTINQRLPFWVYLSNVATLLIALIFALLFWKNKRKLNTLNDVRSAQQQTYFYSEAKAWNELKQNIVAKNLPDLRTSLIRWAQVFWNDPDIINLQSIGSKIQDSSVDKQLQSLDAEIYSGKPQGFDTHELLQVLGSLRRKKVKPKKDNGELTPLYKNGS